MKVEGLFNIKKRGVVVLCTYTVETLPKFKMGDTLSCGDKKWKVTGIGFPHDSCFGPPPEKRFLDVILEPIDHNDQPNVGDELV